MQTAQPYHPTAPFWDKIAPKYARRPIADPAAYEEKLSRVRAFLRAEDRLLEIGCGTGGTALRLAPAVASVTATDVSREMIAIAERKRVDASADTVVFRQAPADVRQDEAPFDVVTAFSLLHLVDDLGAVLDTVYDQIRPGGLFISKTVCLGDANFALRLLVRAMRAFGIAPRVSELRQEELSKALASAGFDLLECQYFGRRRLNPFIVARRPG